ncbi:S9 family peptidase [Lewinella sp. W8]|uniref:alpha/beta hydrolase family protein n=1 Tax=Lewinella sp. W8 TaxID=2528208 RepID=UPI0010686C30|nr:alpha/beta hydrolase [Lewinella sp. W8]MTB49639.1 alpha/beta fold hydrolase [Lewinella sp. W8]
MQRFFLLPLLLFFTVSLPAQIAGEWFAILDAMGTKLPLKIEVVEGEGKRSGTYQSPSQGPTKLPMDRLEFDGKLFRFEIEVVNVQYDAVYDGKVIKGVYNQANQDFPLTFTRYRPNGYPIEEGPMTLRARPQDPTDFPYKREAVRFAGGADDVTIAGELTTPANGKPRAMVVLISGSGPQDRNSYIGAQINHSPFLVVSDFLTRRGYGVLRYDDRGVNESTGDFGAATSADLAKDAWAAVRYLRTRPELSSVPVGLAGHSEGGMLAPMVAAADGDLDFVILLAAPGLPIDSLMLEQRRQVSKAMGVPEVITSRDEQALRDAYAWIKQNTDLTMEEYEEGLYGVFIKAIDDFPEAMRKSIVDRRAYSKQYVDALKSPWMRYFLAFDPTEYLEQLTVPVLAMNGLKDTQVPGLENLNGISAALARAGNEDLTVAPFLNLNHLFQPADTGSPTEYGTIEVTFAEEALQTMADWLDKRF